MKLVSITKSPLRTKKWRATFEHDGHGTTVGKTIFHTDFGAVGYIDYTLGATDKQASAYRQRHRKDLETNNPTKPGFLSYYVLWASPNFSTNVRNYKKRFHL